MDLRQASSVLYEEDIVYGGKASLEKAFGLMNELYDCAVVFVLTGCVAEIMDDDVEGIIGNVPSRTPVFLIKAAGFKGDMVSGITDAMKVLVDNMVGKDRRKNSVNIIGIFSDDFRVDADLKSIKRLLGGNIELNSVIPYDNYNEIISAPAAALNVVFEGFEHVGKHMEQRFGIPYVVVNYPYGIEGSKKFAAKVMDAIGYKDMDFIEKLEIHTVKKLEMAYGYVHRLYGMPVAVRGDYARANALKAFLQNELGMNVEVFRDNFYDGGQDEFEEAAGKSNSVFIFGSSFERRMADELNISLIRYTYPVFDSISIGDRSYAGFDGVINLIEDMANASMTMRYRRDGMYG
jgi:nitrogenase molybdenum-iron protein beta chain